MVKDLWPTADVGICAVCCATAGTVCLWACADPRAGPPLWRWEGGGLTWSLLERPAPLPRATSGTQAGGRALLSLPPPTPTGGSELLMSSSVRTVCLGEFFFGIL